MQETMGRDTGDLFAQYGGLLFAIAYRLVGSVSDAEDIVQEAFVRWLEVSHVRVRSPRPYLSTVVVRLGLDQLRSARARREEYIGPWLPEPRATEADEDLAGPAMVAESLSFACLVLLEELAPLERTVFVLREVFDYAYAEIAAIAGKTEANCRQALHRAREHLRARRRRFAVSCAEQQRITAEFTHAATQGDIQGLLRLLAEDVVVATDCGGQASPERGTCAGANTWRGAGRASRGCLRATG